MGLKKLCFISSHECMDIRFLFSRDERQTLELTTGIDQARQPVRSNDLATQRRTIMQAIVVFSADLHGAQLRLTITPDQIVDMQAATKNL